MLDQGIHKFLIFTLLVLLSGAQPYLFAQESVDSTAIIVIGEISFEGNKTTKDRIVRRELMFAEGDTISEQDLSDLIRRSRENLINTSLFNFVENELDTVAGQPNTISVKFILTERWYVWPVPIIEFSDRNFNTWWKENRDLSRMSYGLTLRWENFRGRKELLELTARFGYIELYGFDYTIPYLNDKKTIGIGLGAGYGRTKESPVINEDNRLIYYKDNEEYVLEGASAYMSFIYRRQIYNSHTLRMQYNWTSFQDTLLSINPDFSVGDLTSLQYFSLSYFYKSDHRDNKPYPLKGYYFDLELVKRGFGVLENGGLDVFYIHATFRKYFQISKRFYFASGLNSKFSNNAEQTFYMSRAIGYGRDIVRGYEYYVVNGHNYGIFKNNLKFALLPQRSFDIEFIRSKKFGRIHYAFYLNAFIDFGYADNAIPVPELNNTLENALLIGYGLGIDFVTYYDLVFRFEYSINRMGEDGFYLHFMAPI